MNSDQTGGKVDQVVGKVKQGVGEVVGSDRLTDEGVADQAKGAVKETWGNAKDAVNQATKPQDAPRDTRNSVSNAIDNAKDSVNRGIENFKEKHS